MRIFLKIADFMDTDEDDDDAEFEDYEDEEVKDDEMEDNGEAEVVDLDKSQEQCFLVIQKYFDYILQRTQPIPQVIGLARQAEDELDELQELSFAVMTSLVYSKLAQIKQFVDTQQSKLLQAFMGFIQVATHKKDRPSCENATECLSAVVEFSSGARETIFNSPEEMKKIVQMGIFISGTSSMARIYII